MTRCYLALGSNLKNPMRQIYKATQALHKFPYTSVINLSRLYFSKSMAEGMQPPYCNRVLALNTRLTAQQLLYYCHRLEQKHQRIRKKKWGPRTLDVDVLLFGNCTVQTHTLTIPHPGLLYRDFVIIPLLEIAPELTLPTGECLREQLKHCNSLYVT